MKPGVRHLEPLATHPFIFSGTGGEGADGNKPGLLLHVEPAVTGVAVGVDAMSSDVHEVGSGFVEHDVEVHARANIG